MEYRAVICSIYNITSVLIEIRGAVLTSPKPPLTSHLDKHDTLIVKREFDFSGSRVLSTYNVAVL